MQTKKTMNLIEDAKTYRGKDLETIFFRPMLTGPSAQELGIRILYNMPVPTTVQLWEGQRDILQKYDAAGWTGGASAKKFQKTIDLHRVKAELGYSAADYFSLIYELVTNRADVNMDDLTGTELEQAETALFRKAIAEGIRVTTWIGNTSSSKGFNTFDGFLKNIMVLSNSDEIFTYNYEKTFLNTPENVIQILDNLWVHATDQLKDLKADGQLAYFVTSDVYYAYEKHLDEKGADAAYHDYQNGRRSLSYHGIPLIDLRLSSYLTGSGYSESFAVLSDRRNLVLAVNTADFPGNEIRMWYNPDLMENRQRAVFMAGCDVLDPYALNFAYRLNT